MTPLRFPLGLLLSLGLLFASACSSLRHDYVKPPSYVVTAEASTPLMHYVQSETRRHPGLSGFRTLIDNKDALTTRIALVDRASRSIDLQYYIFDNDATGRLLALHLLQAGERSVRVRILLDDINLDNQDALLDALDASPQIEVRVFNPLRTRNPSWLSRAAQFILEARRLNRRMHNKSFVVDNAVAVVGGRNIGDAYFDAGNTTNFRDMDVISIGPVVAQASDAFDAYWNSDAAYPVAALRSRHRKHPELGKVHSTLLQEAHAPAAPAAVQQAESDDEGISKLVRVMFWGRATLIADEPEKVDPDNKDPDVFRLSPTIDALIGHAGSEVLLVSPYFVPGNAGSRYLGGLARRGVHVDVLTNSLASSDEIAAHAAYSRRRVAMLKDGVGLYELRPQSASPPATTYGQSRGTSLHAKMGVVDRRYVIVGSMNLDPRSKQYNTETGILIDCPPFAEDLARFFADATAPANAYHLVLENGSRGDPEHVVWLASDDGKPRRFDREPDSNAGRRLQMLLYRLLPIENLL